MENNKKIILPTMVAIITLVMLTIGAAYAYFTVSASNYFGAKTIEATTPALGSVALSTGSNLTMKLTASQMMAGSEDITYYASAEGTTTTATTTNIGTATVIGAGRYTCEYSLTINDNENSLYDAFQSMETKTEGQIILSVNGSDYDFNTENLFSKTISRTMTGLTENTPQNITAELKLVNKTNVDQNDLSGKELTLTFTASNFNCTAETDNEAVDYVLETSSSDLWNSELEEDGIRYVGTNPNNYICFGYSDATTDCDFTNSSNTDLYAYRIIGVFKDSDGEQHLKLIKKESLNTGYIMESDYEGGAGISWGEIDLYYGLNGILDEEWGNYYNNLFVNNLEYSYMSTDNEWYDKIETWDYLTVMSNPGLYTYGPSYKYQKIRTTYLHEMNRSSKSNCVYNSSTAADCGVGEWRIVSAKIGLMHVSDYQLSLGSAALNYLNNNSTYYQSMKTGWMHLSKNDLESPSDEEWTMSMLGSRWWVEAWYVNSNGYIDSHYVYDPDNDEGYFSVRPVFYLTTDVKISGEGTIGSPFIVS